MSDVTLVGRLATVQNWVSLLAGVISTSICRTGMWITGF
jgi:hypothetical protein